MRILLSFIPIVPALIIRAMRTGGQKFGRARRKKLNFQMPERGDSALAPKD
jgi:hypothetical protein